MGEQVTIGLDIGTTSVKGVAADADGNVLARVRVPHEVRVPAADRLEHDVASAWQAGPRSALEQLGVTGARGIAVAAMVPSLAALDDDGAPVTAGILYGDERGRVDLELPPGLPGEAVGFLGALAAEVGDAAVAFGTAQSVANAALGGPAVMDSASAAACYPLFDGTAWSTAHLGGVPATAMPDVAGLGEAVGEVHGATLASGLVDALGEQVVAGAERDGDVLVMLGTTLLTWAVVPEYVQVEGLWTIPHTAAGRFLVGGPSNAGGLFLDHVRRWIAVAADAGAERLDADDPERVPVWLPYVRGERTPLHRHDLRASLHDLDLTHRPVDILRGAYEASAFVIQHHLDLAGVRPERLVVTGGGTRSLAWVQAIADATRTPCDVVAVHEGGALGAAYVARMAAGLETQLSDGARWAHRSHRVEPADGWTGAVADRYARFRELSDQAVG